MSELRPALQAIPSSLHMVSQQFVQPGWDSCDGVDSTFGWDDVTVIADFDRVTSPAQTIAAIKTSLHAMGWTLTSDEQGAWYWQRRLRAGGEASIQLLGDPGDDPPSPWDMEVTVPAAVHPVVGC